MEKTGNDEYVVYLGDTGELVMRCPGGAIIPYDGRFGILPGVIEVGEMRVFHNVAS